MSMINIGGPLTASTLTAMQSGDVQPNAVDLRLGKVLRILSNDFTIDENQKLHRGSEEIEPDVDGYYHLVPGRYEVIMENMIQVADGEAGWVITRSTLNRNGVYLTSGLYDAGYHGVMASVMHVTTGTMHVQRGTRIGQYLNFNAETLSLYNGDYGIGKEFDEKNYEGK